VLKRQEDTLEQMKVRGDRPSDISYKRQQFENEPMALQIERLKAEEKRAYEVEQGRSYLASLRTQPAEPDPPRQNETEDRQSGERGAEKEMTDAKSARIAKIHERGAEIDAFDAARQETFSRDRGSRD